MQQANGVGTNIGLDATACWLILCTASQERNIDLKYPELNKRIISERARLRAALLVEIQEKYKIEAPLRAIEQQLAGVKVSKEPKFYLTSQKTLFQSGDG